MGIKMQVKTKNKQIHAHTDGNILLTQYSKIIETVNAIPVIAGMYDNSIQFKNGDNQIYADYAVALGFNTIAGSLAYPIIGLDQKNKYYIVQLNDNETIDTSIVGHKYSVYLSGSADDCGTIVDVVNNHIYVDVLYIPDKAIDYNEAFIKIIGVPYAGNMPIGMGATSFGINCVSSAAGALSHGINAIANGRYSYSGGKDTYANFAAHAEGQGTQALDWGCHAEGLWAIAVTKAGHAEGYYTEALGQGGHSEGGFTIAVQQYGHSEGFKTFSCGAYSHTQNDNTVALASGSSASGDRTIAGARYLNIHSSTSSYYCEYIIKYGDKIKKLPTDLKGKECSIFVDNSTLIVAEILEVRPDPNNTDRFRIKIDSDKFVRATSGFIVLNIPLGTDYKLRNELVSYGINTTGQAANATGIETRAIGVASYSGGTKTIAIEVNSFAHGQDVIAWHENSVAFGEGTHTSRKNQFVAGQYNEKVDNAIFILGNGTDDKKRSNALVVGEDGTVYNNKGALLTAQDVPDANSGILIRGKSVNAQWRANYDEYFHDDYNNLSTTVFQLNKNLVPGSVKLSYCYGSEGYDGVSYYLQGIDNGDGTWTVTKKDIGYAGYHGGTIDYKNGVITLQQPWDSGGYADGSEMTIDYQYTSDNGQEYALDYADHILHKIITNAKDAFVEAGSGLCRTQQKLIIEDTVVYDEHHMEGFPELHSDIIPNTLEGCVKRVVGETYIEEYWFKDNGEGKLIVTAVNDSYTWLSVGDWCGSIDYSTGDLDPFDEEIVECKYQAYAGPAHAVGIDYEDITLNAFIDEKIEQAIKPIKEMLNQIINGGNE